MLVSYSWLNSFFKKPLPKPEKLAEFLTLHSFENENISEIKNDWILNLDVLPDRAGDCQSHFGVAREISAIIGHNLIHPEIKFKEHPTLKTKNFLEIEIKDKDCRRYVSRVINNVKIGPSPKWLQEKLSACNINSINNVVDATNFVMLELGQPLHAFDYDKIENKKIIVKKAKAGEKIPLLGGAEVTLDKTMLTISDGEGAIAIAGIKGGKKAEIDNNTKNIVLESANFTPKLISQTARKLNIRTDASMRFEHQLDPNLADIAIDRVTTIITQITEGDILSGKIDIYPEKIKPIKLKLEIELLDKILGISIPKKEIETILTRLGFHILQSNKKNISIEIPTWRQDVIISENLIEEIGRIYGYEKINPAMPCVPITMAQKNEELFWQNKVKNILKNIGWTEVYNYSFIGDEEVGFFSLEAEEIKNPVSIFSKFLRPTLMPQILKNAKENLKSFKEIKLYELGKTFIKNDKKINEKQCLSGIVINPAFKKQELFLKLKGEIEYLLRELGIKKIEFVKTKENIWQNNNSLDVLCNRICIGSFGELSDDTAEIMQIEENAIIFNFDSILEQCSEEKEYKRVSFHPLAYRDISGIIDDTVSNTEILEAIEKMEKPDLITIEKSIIDIYKKNLPNDKKSITLKIILEHSEKTLNTEEIDTIVKKIINCLSDKFGWEERK
ncbi:MAG: phenylalanine--tRNA ligase subunit beta [Candidatus Pacebacteria bacterium]|nr:phenylalanine--tRNA ligase subunit beta [Candidatus Paceibacterota bacterium]